MNAETSIGSKRTTDQKKTFRKEDEDGNVYIAHVRFDDQCGNGYNTFAITCDVYDRSDRIPGEDRIRNSAGQSRWLGAFGRCHDVIRAQFPDLAPLLKWHLTSTDGPLHYLANTLFWVREGNLDHARSSAVAPDATAEQLADPEWLKARLPALLAEFRAAVESLGLTW